MIFDTGREPIFVLLLSFIITFMLARAYTRIARIRGWGSASFGGVHAHHLVFGLVIAFLAAGLEFAFAPDPGLLQVLLAAAFGAGAALVLDEFALVFHLEDVYWEKEGRKSVDAVVIGLLLGFLFLLHTKPLGINASESAKIVTLAIILNLIFVCIAALKGKFLVATFGVFVPLLAQVGALRLAEPGSIWAHKWYDPRGAKMKKSKKRYIAYEKKWRPKKERLWDILGGKAELPLLRK